MKAIPPDPKATIEARREEDIEEAQDTIFEQGEEVMLAASDGCSGLGDALIFSAPPA